MRKSARKLIGRKRCSGGKYVHVNQSNPAPIKKLEYQMEGARKARANNKRRPGGSSDAKTLRGKEERHL